MQADKDKSLSSVKTLLANFWNCANAGKAKPQVIGYLRLHPGHPDDIAARQVDQLRSLGCARVLLDRVKGSAVARPGLDEAIALLRPGDILVVMSLEHIAWREDSLWETLLLLAKNKAHVVAGLEHFSTLAQAETFAVVQAMARFAENVRQMRLADNSIDRREKISDADWNVLYGKITRGELSKEAAAVQAGVSLSTIYRRIAA